MRVEPKPMELAPRALDLIQEIGRGQELFAPYGLDPDQAAIELASITEPMFQGAALPIVTIHQLRWYVRDLARAFRVLNGFALAFWLRLVMRKWAVLGLEPDLMGMVLEVVVNQLRLMPEPEQVRLEPDSALLVPVEAVEAREPVLPPIRAGPLARYSRAGRETVVDRGDCAFY